MSFYLKTILIGFFIMLHMSSILAQITSQTYQSAIESADKFYIEKDYLSAKSTKITPPCSCIILAMS
jgi:hypothetical protein